MANMIMSSIYNHYMTTYSPRKTDARLDSHNKNELKNIYGKILKLNKEAPLYVYDQSPQTTTFALALKENTRQLQHTILDAAGNQQNDLFKNKTAYSSDETVISARYIGENKELTDKNETHEIEVHNLASKQVNMGKFLDSNALALENGTYVFGIRSNNFTYEFEFTVDPDNTNLDLQSRLAHLLNQSNIGLNASIIDGGNGTSSLKIESLKTGDGNPPGTPLFVIQGTEDEPDLIDYLGIDYIASNSNDARFSINGEEISTASNQFTVDDTYEISLNGVSSGEPTTFGVKADIESLKSNICNLISGYNSFLQAADEYRMLTSSGKLSSEIQNVAKLYHNELDSVGINISKNGTLSVDDNLLTQTAQSEDAYELLSPLKDFSSTLFEKGEEISRDPLNYTKRKMVAYKNPGKNFPSPYATSSYSGLLFNYYC